jgi:hypothetical protein
VEKLIANKLVVIASTYGLIPAIAHISIFFHIVMPPTLHVSVGVGGILYRLYLRD